jgi:hypothetical protein
LHSLNKFIPFFGIFCDLFYKLDYPCSILVISWQKVSLQTPAKKPAKNRFYITNMARLDFKTSPKNIESKPIQYFSRT